MQALRWFVLVIALVVLTSIGGLGIVTAPVLIPLLLLLGATTASRAFRSASAVVVGLTVAEIVWVASARLAPHTAWAAILPIAAVLVAAFVAWRVQDLGTNPRRHVSAV